MNGIDVEAGGKNYRLTFTTNALCRIEEKLGTGVADIVGALADHGAFRISTARTLFWGAMIEHHPDATLADAGKIMDAVGIAKASAIISAAMVQAFPETAPAAGGGGPLAGDGIGSTS